MTDPQPRAFSRYAAMVMLMSGCSSDDAVDEPMESTWGLSATWGVFTSTETSSGAETSSGTGTTSNTESSTGATSTSTGPVDVEGSETGSSSDGGSQGELGSTETAGDPSDATSSDTGGEEPLALEARPDRYMVEIGEILEIGADEGVLTNDGAGDGSALTVTAEEMISGQSGAVLSLRPDGSFVYTPSQLWPWWGEERFVYTVTSTVGIASAVELRIAVKPSPGPIDALHDVVGGFAIEHGAPLTALGGVGDINTDGLEDIALTTGNPGRSYIVFGRPAPATPLDVAVLEQDQAGIEIVAEDSLAGSGPLVISGAGDINGDGFHDIVIGAAQIFGQYGDRAGRIYVVLGTSNLPSTIELAEIAQGNGGFRIDGSTADEYAGQALGSAGDVNQDGWSDIIIGAPGPQYPNHAGRMYVVFGTQQTSPISLRIVGAGIGGYSVGGRPGERLGLAVSGLGDINGDGFDDIAAAGRLEEAHIILGSEAQTMTSATVGAETESTILIEGESPISAIGGRTDINGDGFADVVLGAAAGGASGAGRVYVVYGAPTLGSVIQLEDVATTGMGGIGIDGEVSRDGFGASVAGLVDFNGDGYGDLALAAPDAAPQNCYTCGSWHGRTYVLWGGDSLQTGLGLADVVSGELGVVFDGSFSGGRSGAFLGAAGDVNGDGLDDLLIAPRYLTTAYAVVGGDFSAVVDVRGTEQNDSATGTRASERFIGGLGDDVLVGNGGSDVLYGGPGDDVLAIFDAAFFQIDGGTGEDTLRFDGRDAELDLTTISDLAIRGIERIDLTGRGDNRLRLAFRDLRAMAEDQRVVAIVGNEGDQVVFEAEGRPFFEHASPGGTVLTLASLSLDVASPIELQVRP